LPLFFAAISNSLRRRLNGLAPNSSYSFLKSICAYKYVSSLSQHTLYVTSYYDKTRSILHEIYH
jgi:hypothetical protein